MVIWGRAADHADLAVPQSDQTGDCLVGRGVVVHPYHGEVGEAQLLADDGSQHGGDGDLVKALAEVLHAAAQENDPLGLDLPQDLFGGLHLVGVFVQVRDDATVAVQPHHPLQVDQEIGKEHILGALDHKYHAAGLLDLQLAGVGVGDKAHLPHDLQDVLLGLGADVGPVVDDPGNGADRTAADPGDVFDRHAQQLLSVAVVAGSTGIVCGIVPDASIMAQLPKKINHLKASLWNCSRPPRPFCAL